MKRIIMTPYEDFNILHTLLKDWRLYELLAAAIGSAAGAWFVFKVAKFSEVQKLKQQESQSLNKAFSIVFTYTNSAHNFLKLLQPKIDELNSMTDQVEKAHTIAFEQDGVGLIVPFKEAFQHIQEVEFLSGSAFAAISALNTISGRPNIFSVLLEKSAKSLNLSILSHNQKIVELKSETDSNLVVSKILGLVESSGSVDESYRHHLENMRIAAKEIIFFGTDILREIAKHHKSLKRMFKDRDLRILRLMDDTSLEIEKDAEYLNSWNNFPTITMPLK